MGGSGLATAGLLGGTALAGALGGKDGGTSTPDMNVAQQYAAGIAGANYGNSTGLQNAFYRDLSKFMGVPNMLDYSDPNRTNVKYIQGMKSDYDVSKLPSYEPLFGLQKQSLESQYQLAKKNIMGATPAGGNLTGALTNLEGQRATAVGNLPAEIAAPLVQDYVNKAYGIATQNPQTSIAGLSSIGNSYANLQAQAMAADASNSAATTGLYGALGSGLGRAIGGKKDE